MIFKTKGKLTMVSACLAFLGFLFILPSAYAEENLQSMLKEVAEKVGAIEDVKNNLSLNEEDKKTKELQTRKDALSKIFDLTLLEDNDLKKKLAGIKNLNESEKKIKINLIANLEENGNAYSEMKSRLKEANSIAAVKQLAIDFKNWRNLVYNPKVEKIISFTLVFQQKKTLDTAQQRLEKIKLDLEKLEGAKLIKMEETANLLNKAGNGLSRANELNKQAELIFLKNINEDDLRQNDAQIEEAATPKTLVEESLKEIKNAYKIFIDIGNLVKAKIAK